MSISCLVVFSLLSTAYLASAERRHTVFILVGGTGDLAAKYLWDGIFNVYHNRFEGHTGGFESEAAANHTFDFLAAGRTAQDQGNIILNSVLKSSIQCPEDSPHHTTCTKRATDFINKAIYMSLKEDADFVLLCNEIQDLFSRTSFGVKQELILYLAIAPAHYENVAEKFHKKCAQKMRELHVSLKVAIEKPFGLD
ncbi:hypothetical protein EGW08_000814, partial [Elysia chlorotica]